MVLEALERPGSHLAGLTIEYVTREHRANHHDSTSETLASPEIRGNSRQPGHRRRSRRESCAEPPHGDAARTAAAVTCGFPGG